jgi:glycosyltransferase 2 family protein
MMIGYLANNVMPARAGEFVRACVLGKKEHISKSMVFTTVLVERLTDLLITLLLLALVVWIFPFPPWLINGGILLGLIGGVAFIFLIALNIFGERLITWGKSTFDFLPATFVKRIESVAFNVISGAAILRRAKNLFPFFACTIVIWFIETLFVWSLAHSFNLPLHGALFVMLMIGIGSMVPSSPGNMGTFEFFASSALDLMLITRAPALCFVIVLHALSFLGSTLIGGVCLYVSGHRVITSMGTVELDDIHARIPS